VPRLHLSIPEPLPEIVPVDEDRLHYLAHVLRLRVGDALEVFDGRGRAFEATVQGLEPGKAYLKLGAARAVPLSATRPVAIIQGLPKADKLEWVLQKGTELGAASFLLAETERTVVRLSDERGAGRLARWKKIVEEAARQCGRSDVPGVGAPRPLEACVQSLPPGTQVFILDEEERAVSLARALARAPANAPLALVVGPEGGLTREEVGALTTRGAIAVTLGPLKLRTETAALVALTVVRLHDGALE